MKSKSGSSGQGRQEGANGQKQSSAAQSGKQASGMTNQKQASGNQRQPADQKQSSGSNGQRQSSSSRPAASNTRSQKNTAQVSGGSEDSSALRKLLVDMMKDVYWAEKALTKALPKMAKNATSPELMEALQDHLAVTEEQISRLEQGFQMLEEKAQAKKCEAMAGLIKEAEEMMKDNKKGMIRDAAIIAAGQKVEHYEIATYGTICAFAKTLGESELSSLMEETLNEEKEADQTLTTVAETAVNMAAAEEEDDEDDDEEEEDDDDEESEDKESDNSEEESTGSTATKQANKSGGGAKSTKSKK